MNEKHKLMKPKDSARIGRQASHRAKKWQSRLSAALLCTLLFTVFFSSCRDEDFAPSAGTRADIARADGTLNDGGAGLVRNSDGTWTATRRVPLVGKGRVIDNISESFVSLGIYDINKGAIDEVDKYEQAAQRLIDTDLTNAFTPSSVVGANLVLNQIISVRDLNYEYAGGQKVGFALQNSDGVLSVDVLEGLWVDTYLNGQATGDKFAFTISSGLINIGLGSVTGGDATSIYVVEGTAKKPFDEVRLGRNGVNVDLFNNLSILYAYVGENPIIPAINVGTDKMDQYKLSYDYFNNEVKAPTEPKWTSDPGSVYKLIDDDLTNGPGTFLVDASSVTVDFGRTIPSGSEVGFYTTYWQLVGADLGGTYVLEAYNDADEKVASYSSSTILNVSIGEGGEIWTTMRIPDDCTDCSRLKFGITGANVTVGGSSIHYAYVREPTVVDVSSYFTLADATVYVPNYRFADPDVPGASVQYEVISRPLTATSDMGKIEGNLLKNMNVEGPYVVKATYREGGKDPIICTATITRKAKVKTYCNNPLTNEEDKEAEWEAYAINDDWGVEIFGQNYKGNLANVVDDRTDNFITADASAISLINNAGIIGVRALNGQKINSGGNKVVRAGFVINRVNEFLAAEVLKFLQIKLFNGTDEVQSDVAFNNNGVSLGLIGNSGENGLARISIDTDKEFDRIELYYGGALEINLGEYIQIYYAFWDDASDECANPGEECMELITNANYGAEAFVNTKGLLTAGDIIFDVGNIVDGDNESAATFVRIADLGTAREIEVTFDEIQGGQEIGFILSDITALGNIELISVVQIFAYNGEQEVSESTSGGGLNVKLLGGGERSYVSVTPPKDSRINRLKLVLGSGINALDNFNIYGIFIRPDYDGDGVMDCIEDGLLTDLTSLKVSPEHVCSATELEFMIEGGVENNTYNLVFNNLSYDNVADIRTTASKKGNQLVLNEPDFLTSLPTGYYNVIVDQDNDFITEPFSVHPKETTWLGYSADWNDWDNWDNGVPWECTNVILPASSQYRNQMNAKHLLSTSSPDYYPVLEDEVDSSTPFCCDNIHFEPGAELIGQKYLKYTKALIDVNINTGYYHLFSAPLQNMVTGDMFVLEEGKRDDWAINWRTLSEAIGNFEPLHHNYFLPVNSDEANGAYEEHRINPLISQRFWSKNVTNVSMSRSLSADNPYNTADQAIVLMTDWSRSFNAVNTVYECGQGFALMVEKKDNATFYEFHFPKAHTAYHYYTIGGGDTGTGASISRSNLTTGRLMEGSITLKREEAGSYFLFGNPLMASINIQKFMNGNPSIQSVKVYQYKEGNAGEYVTISKDGTSTISNPPMFIAPMQALFVETSTSSGETCSITLTDDMTIPDYVSQTSATAPNQLRLTATSRGHSASCVVVPSSAASDDYDALEDATLLVGSEEGSGVAVYTVAGGKALSIQRMNQSGRIPVGFYLKEEGNVTLSFDPQGDAWRGWNLVDQQTGKRYPLDSETNLGTVKSGAGRFYLERTGN